MKKACKAIKVTVNVCALYGLVGCGPFGSAHSWVPKTAASLSSESGNPGWAASFADWELRKKLNNVLRRDYPDIHAKVSLYVLDKQVLIVGVLKSKEQVKQLKALFASVAPDATVINKTVFADSYSVGVRMHDLWLEKKIETNLLFSDVASHNFEAIVFNGVAYILGVARTKEEYTKAMRLIKEVAGITKVEDFVRVVTSAKDFTQYHANVCKDAQTAQKKQKALRQEEKQSDNAGIPGHIPGAVRAKVEVVHVKDEDDD